MSAEPLKDCPECQEPQLVKLVSAAGFQLKGTGWYQTDFKGSSKPAESSAKASTEKSAGGHSCGTGGCPSCN